jgi:glutamate racemase
VIGVFDSGIGGLTVLVDLAAELPDEHLVYVADQAHCPYGGRPAEVIVTRTFAIADGLVAEGAKMLIVACNTATIAAIAPLRDRHAAVPVVGIEPAVKPAVARSRSHIVGVLATEGSLGGEKFRGLVAEHRGDADVLTQSCPGLVDQIESGDLDGPETRALIERYTRPLVAAGADVLVLGCTHYPLVRDLIAEVVGPDIALVDPGAAIAQRARTVLTEGDALDPGPGSVELRSTAGIDLWPLYRSLSR